MLLVGFFWIDPKDQGEYVYRLEKADKAGLTDAAMRCLKPDNW